MRFIRLTRFDGEPIWINAARVLWLESAGRRDAVGGGTLVVFSTADDDTTRVKEAPCDVAMLCLDPS